jgi:hypothetical protein
MPNTAKSRGTKRARLRQPKIIRQTISDSGRFDAAKIARLLGWSLADLGHYLDRDPSTVSRSRAAQTHQDRLAVLAALVQETFVLMNEDLPATIAWFRTPIAALDWKSPRELILSGEVRMVTNLVNEVSSGFAL